MTWFDKSRLGCFLQDDKGQLSHARLLAVIVGVSATFFMWKLTIMGDLTAEYFLYYLSYGVIHQNLNKCLDVLKAWFTRGDQSPPPSV